MFNPAKYHIWQPIWIKWSDVRNVEFEFHEILLPITQDVHFGQIKLNSCLIFIFLNRAVGILCTICSSRLKNLSSHKSFIACEKFWPRSSVHTSSKSYWKKEKIWTKVLKMDKQGALTTSTNRHAHQFIHHCPQPWAFGGEITGSQKKQIFSSLNPRNDMTKWGP